MNSIAVNQVFLFVFILVNLFIGAWAGRKVNTITDYVLGNRSLGIGTLTITLIATFIEITYILSIYRSYSLGFINFVFATIRTTIPAVLLGRYVLPNLVHFRDCYTMGDIMEKVYGSYARLWTGIITTLFSIFVIAGQLLGMAYLSTFFGLSEPLAIVLTGSAIVFYTFTGGIRSVACTDVLQFIVVIVGIVTIVSLGLAAINVANIPALFHKVIKEFPQNMQLLRHPFLVWQIHSSILYGFFPTIFFAPPIIQRVLMTKSKKEVNSMFVNLSVFYTLFRLSILILGFILLIAANQKNIYIDLHNSLTYICQNIVQNIYLRAFCLIGLVAILMSTADSYLNTLIILIDQDILYFFRKKQSMILHSVTKIRRIALIVGVCSIILSIAFLKLRVINVLPLSIIILSSITLPFLAAMIGMKGSSHIFHMTFFTFITVFGFLLFFTSWFDAKLLPESVAIPIEEINFASSYPACLWAIAASTIIFLLLHYRENKGFVFLKKTKISLGSSFCSSPIVWYHMFSKPMNWIEKKIQSYGGQPLLLGFFISFFNMLPCLMTHTNPHVHLTLVILKIIGIVLCTGLLLQKQWPQSLKKYYNLFYYITLFYCLPFFNAFLLLQDINSSLLGLIFILHLILLTILVDWESFVMLAITGILLAVSLYILINGTAFPAFSFEAMWNIIFGTIFTLFVGLLFARRKQYLYQVQQQKQGYLVKEHEETQKILVQASQLHYKVAKGLQGEEIDITKKIENIADFLNKKGQENADIRVAAKEISVVKNYLNELIYHYKDHMHLTVQKISLNALIGGLYQVAPAADIELDNIIVQLKTKQKSIQCDPEKVKQTLLNALKSVQKNNLSKSFIYLTITDVELGYQISGLKNYMRKIEAIRFVITTEENQKFPDLLYIGDLETAENIPFTTSTDLPRLQNKRIIEAHYGFIEDALVMGINTLLFVLPVKVRAIRPTSMDKKKIPRRLVISHPNASVVEKRLYKSIRLKCPNINLNKVQKAILVAKNYHAIQKRKSGEPFYFHPLAVAEILLNFIQEEEVIVAAILHDVVEDTAMGSSKLELMFGSVVSQLVHGVTKLTKGRRQARLSNEDSILQLIREEDQRVLKIKLADRLHNMRTIHGHPDYYKRVRIAEETLQFFVPMAQKIGLLHIEEELKSLVFDILHYQDNSQSHYESLGL
ncbi:MAG: HD domain-containing protein [Bacteroidota bacterium]